MDQVAKVAVAIACLDRAPSVVIFHSARALARVGNVRSSLFKRSCRGIMQELIVGRRAVVPIYSGSSKEVLCFLRGNVKVNVPLMIVARSLGHRGPSGVSGSGNCHYPSCRVLAFLPVMINRLASPLPPVPCYFSSAPPPVSG